MTAVTVLGLGAMGSRLAARIVDAGHDVTVWNRSPDAARRLADATGATAAASARAAVRSAEVTIAMLADDDASRSVWLGDHDGALAALPAGSIAVDASTLTPELARQLAAAADAVNVGFLEAPVVGSRPQAEAGALFVLVGGDDDVLARARPVIDAYAGAVRPVGSVGNAATMKLAINGLFGVQVAAYAEIVGLLARTDVAIEDATAILSGLPITSPGLQRILGLIADREFAPNFPISLVAKDFRYLEELARHAAADVPVASATSAVYARGADGPRAELDIAGIADRYLEDAPEAHTGSPARRAGRTQTSVPCA